MKLNAATEATILKSTILIFSFLFYSITAKAQVQVSEGFDQSYSGTTYPNQELPFGWQFGRIAPGTDGNNYWERVNAANGTNPTCTPHNGSLGMMRYRSFYCNNVEKAYLLSRPFDLSQRPAGAPSNLRFWMWRDPAVQNDNVEIRVSANPDPTAAGFVTLVDTFTFITTINRPCLSTPPAVTCSGWNLYAFTIPANTFSISNLYVSIIAQNSGPLGSNIYIDDFSIVTYPAAQTFNTVSLEYQNAEWVGKNTVNNWILGIRINVNGAAAPIVPGAFTFSPNASSNPNPGIDISMTKLWFTCGTNTFPTDAAGQPKNAILTASVNPVWPVATWTLTPGFGGTAVQLQNGDNYFWLTYDVPVGAVTGDFIDADFISAVIGTTHICGTSGCTLPGGRLIGVAYCQPVYTLGTSGTNGSYTNNDYIKTVSITNVGGTDPSFIPLYNDHNDKGPDVVGAGYPADPVCNLSDYDQRGIISFHVHPQDYQRFTDPVTPNLCSAGNSTRTCSFIETSISPPIYNINLQCGTWFGGKFMAAFIDLNHDGDFVDPQEKIIQTTSMTQLSWQNADLWIPTTYGYFGNTTLRVREWYGQPNIDACTPGYYGETEDYTVTLKTPCNPPGWDVWLGFTDDWNTTTNWCGGIPTSSTDVLIPQAAPYHPVIKSGVVAAARKIRIENDTLEINAPTAGSLTIHDSLFVSNNSLLKVNYTTDSSIQVSNGVFTNTVYVPFRASWKEQKMQLMYKSSELLALGLLDGDVINSICVPIRSRKSVQPYTNVTISVYYAQSGGSYPAFATTGFTSPVPPANALASVYPGVPAAYGSFPSVVWTGSIDMTTIPLNLAGTKDIPLSTPFKFWASANNPLIIEICYEMSVISTDDQMWQTQTTGYRSVLLLAHLSNAQGSGCSFGASTAALNQKQSSDLRPNLCFSFHRDYTKYPINIKGHWKNNGNFIAGNSIVTFDGSANQRIAGANNTTFNDLTINNASGVKIITAAKVEDTLNLVSGKLDLNERAITIFNHGPGGIIRTSGTIVSETPPPNYGSVVWKIGATTGPHLIPFQTSGGKYIPFTYNLTSGNVGMVTVATYHTPANNLPLPTGVTNINDTNNANNAAFTADRFWDIQKTGTSGKAKLKFTYLNSEAPAPIVNGNLIAQRYNFANNKWVILPYAITNTVNSSTSEVLVTGVTGNNLNSSVWAMADVSSPLRMMNDAVNEPEVAPNPFTDKITVSLSLNPGNDKTVALTLYTVLGEKAAETTVPAGLFSDGESYEWAPGTVKAGVYFLTIQTKDDIHTVRVVKMKD